MVAAATKAEPHEQKVAAEECAGDADEHPACSHTYCVWEETVVSGLKWLTYLLQAISVHETTKDGAEQADEDNTVQGEPEVLTDQAAGKPLAVGHTWYDEVNRTEHAHGEESIEC